MRPRTVKISTGIMALLLAAWWVPLYWRRADQLFVGIVVLSFSVSVACPILIAYWRGKSWARLAVIVFSIFVIAQFPLEELKHTLLLQAIDWAQFVLAVFLLFYLNGREARTFFGALYQERPAIQ